MKITIINKSSWRARELRKLVTLVKREWFDPNQERYRIIFKDCKGSTDAHGWAYYTRGVCEVFLPTPKWNPEGQVSVWMARVIRHELLHLVEQKGGRAWEIEQRRVDRKWAKCPELRKKIPWVNELKLVKKGET